MRDLSLHIRQLFQRRSTVQAMRELVAQLLARMRMSGKLPKVRLNPSVVVGCPKARFKSRRAALVSLTLPWLRPLCYFSPRWVSSLHFYSYRHGVKLFAYHVWQRARQNSIYIEIPPLTNRNRPRPNPFIEPRVMGLYCRAREVLGCLPVFDHSRISQCHIFVLFSSRGGLDHVSVCAPGLRQRVLEQTVEGRQRFAAAVLSKFNDPRPNGCEPHV